MATIPTKEPETFTVGDRLKFKIYSADYLPSDWTLSYAMVSDGQQITFTGSDNGDGYHLIDVDAITTAGWTAGTYKYQGYVTDTNSPTARVTIRTGTVVLEANFDAQTAGFDPRSHVKATLDALEATIAGKASADQLSYSIAGRSISKINPEELLLWRDRYREEYRRELAAERLSKGLGSGNIVRVRRHGANY